MLAGLVLLFASVHPLVCAPDHINRPAEDTKCVMVEKVPPVPKHEIWDACWLMVNGQTGKKDWYSYDCYWDSYHWYPEQRDVVKDFMSRSGDLETEHTIAHWGVSFKEEFSMSGDCGFGSYKVTYHNTARIKDLDEFRYYRLTVSNGECGDRNEWGFKVKMTGWSK